MSETCSYTTRENTTGENIIPFYEPHSLLTIGITCNLITCEKEQQQTLTPATSIENREDLQNVEKQIQDRDEE